MVVIIEIFVSISSKIIVGKFKFVDSIYLIDSNILDNSPPDATLNKESCSIPLFAENKTSISSDPN